MTWRPRLRTILVLVNLMILVLPLSGIAVLRLYESALVRQTESELIAQGAFVAAAYKAALARTFASFPGGVVSFEHYGRPLVPPWEQPADPASRWRPRPAVLDLAVDRVRAAPPDAPLPSAGADGLALLVGRQIMALIRDAQVITLAGIRVVDYQGIVVASTGEGMGTSLTDREEISRALAGEHVSLLRRRVSDEATPPLLSISRGTHVRVFVAMPIAQDRRVLGAIMLSRTPANIAQALHHKRYLLLYAALISLAVVLTVSLITAFTISRPVRAVIEQTQKAARGEKGAVVALQHPMTREIAQLSEAVARMARTLEQRADYIRDFASHVSHEFKTPLTAIRGAVELLRDHTETMSGAERDRFLNNLSADASRLENLVRRLLDLARADMIHVAGHTADVARVLEGVAQRYNQLGMTVNLKDATPEVTGAAVAEDMLASIIANLLDNACQHAGDQVTVDITLSRSEQWLLIAVADNGSGISEANAARIFEPFFTTARKQGGTGLGLAVVKSLLSAHQGRIRLLPAKRGAAFEIQIPIKRAAS